MLLRARGKVQKGKANGARRLLLCRRCGKTLH